jgi:hypothetical protein
VQYLGQSKRVFYSLVMMSVAFGLDLSQSSDSVAQIPVDYVCYIQTSDGRTIDLGKLCGSSGSGRPIALGPKDQDFLNSYQRSLRKRLNSSSSDALSRVQRNPQAAIQRAREICKALSGAIASAITGDSQVGGAARIASVSWGGYCGDRVKENRLTLVLKPA